QFMAHASVQVGSPQHAGENAVVLRAAASPPRTHTQLRNRSCRNRNQALRPRINNPAGAKIFAKSTGPKSGESVQQQTMRQEVKSRTKPGYSTPSQFKS